MEQTAARYEAMIDGMTAEMEKAKVRGENAERRAEKKVAEKRAYFKSKYDEQVDQGKTRAMENIELQKELLQYRTQCTELR